MSGRLPAVKGPPASTLLYPQAEGRGNDLASKRSEAIQIPWTAPDVIDGKLACPRIIKHLDETVAAIMQSTGPPLVGTQKGGANNLINDYGCLRPGELLNGSVVNGHLAVMGRKYQHVMVLSSNYTLRSRQVSWPRGTKIIPNGHTKMAICAKFLGYTSSMHPLAIASSTTVLVEPLVTCIIVFYHLIQKFTPIVKDL